MAHLQAGQPGLGAVGEGHFALLPRYGGHDVLEERGGLVGAQEGRAEVYDHALVQVFCDQLIAGRGGRSGRAFHLFVVVGRLFLLFLLFAVTFYRSFAIGSAFIRDRFSLFCLSRIFFAVRVRCWECSFSGQSNQLAQQVWQAVGRGVQDQVRRWRERALALGYLPSPLFATQDDVAELLHRLQEANTAFSTDIKHHPCLFDLLPTATVDAVEEPRDDHTNAKKRRHISDDLRLLHVEQCTRHIQGTSA